MNDSSYNMVFLFLYSTPPDTAQTGAKIPNQVVPPSAPEKKLQMKRKKKAPVAQKKTVKRRRMTEMPSFDDRYDGRHHTPAVSRNSSQHRCRMEGCTLKSNYFCMKCNVYLCIKETNCYEKFHYQL